MAAQGIHSASEKTKIKRRRNKTLAKPMLYNRSLNCRASGLLEQSGAHEAAHRPFFTCVIRVLGCSVTTGRSRKTLQFVVSP